MKRVLLALGCVVIAAAALISCGGNANGGGRDVIIPSTTTTFVFVANQSMQAVFGYKLDQNTGALTLASQAATLGGGTRRLAYDNNHQLLYALNEFDGSLASFKVDTQTGALTSVVGSPFVVGGSPATGLALTPGGGFVLVAHSLQYISVFAVNPSTYALTEVTGSPFMTGGLQPYGMAIDPTGKFLYVATSAIPSKIDAYNVDATNGTLTSQTIARYPTNQNQTQELLYSPAGNVLYASNLSSHSVSAYMVNPSTGVLTAISGSPFESVLTPMMMAATTKQLYVLGTGTSNQLAVYNLQTSGALQAASFSPVTLGGFLNPWGIAVTPSGKFAILTDNGSAAGVHTYNIDSATGALTEASGSPTGGNDGWTGVVVLEYITTT